MVSNPLITSNIARTRPLAYLLCIHVLKWLLVECNQYNTDALGDIVSVFCIDISNLDTRWICECGLTLSYCSWSLAMCTVAKTTGKGCTFPLFTLATSPEEDRRVSSTSAENADLGHASYLDNPRCVLQSLRVPWLLIVCNFGRKKLRFWIKSLKVCPALRKSAVFRACAVISVTAHGSVAERFRQWTVPLHAHGFFDMHAGSRSILRCDTFFSWFSFSFIICTRY